jgi:GT2 family glycosyltransferase
MTTIHISILNWNDAAATFECVRTVRQSVVPEDVTVSLTVLDNGSHADDWESLQSGFAGTELKLIRQEVNTGFAAGHNVVIRQAIAQKADYIWLLNNDATVKADTLTALLKTISEDPKCGVVSPLIYAHFDADVVDFVGAVQDWKSLDSKRAGDAKAAAEMQVSQSHDFFVYGTAPLFRVSALKEAGLLDEKFFAYYEDEELCARFAKADWFSKMAFFARIQHFKCKFNFDERPPYYFYLMARNALLFYVRHTPSEFRRGIRLRLFSRSMIQAAKLRELGLANKSNACLLGTWDGLRGRGGPPRLDALPPTWLIWASKVFPYRLQQWLD